MEEYTRLQNQINVQPSKTSVSTHNISENGLNNAYNKMKSFTLQNSQSNGSHRNRHQQFVNTQSIVQSKYKTASSANSRALSSSPVSLSHTSVSFGYPTSNTINNNIHNPYYQMSNSSLLNSTSMINNLHGTSYSKLPNLFKPLNRSVNMLYNGASYTNGTNSINSKETQLLNEARMLRQHEDRLEARMKILENHNRLLDAQLRQLKSLLNKVQKKNL